MRRLSWVLFLLIILSFADVSVANAQSLTFLCAGMNHPCVDIFTNEEMRPFPPEPEDPVTIRIQFPQPGDKFFFNSRQPGTMEIIAVAVVEPSEYADQVEWKMDAIGSSTQTVEPSRGASVTIKFEGLPENNNDFGDKTITASVGGKSDNVTVQVFYWPEATNHAGEGQGETPNWFYYWSQTKAAHGPMDKLEYVQGLTPKNRPTDNSLGRYERDDDTIKLSDKLFPSKECTRRAEAGHGKENATGIDCYAELLRHETRHRYEEFEWWRKGSNVFLRFIEAFAHDADLDMVPAWLEKAEPGCVDSNMWSCTDRPTFTTEPKEVPDTELYAYYEGWKWNLGTADSEDWSFCGKQWRKTSPGDCQ